MPRNSVVRLTDGSSYVPKVPSYLKTHISLKSERTINQKYLYYKPLSVAYDITSTTCTNLYSFIRYTIARNTRKLAFFFFFFFFIRAFFIYTKVETHFLGTRSTYVIKRIVKLRYPTLPSPSCTCSYNVRMSHLDASWSFSAPPTPYTKTCQNSEHYNNYMTMQCVLNKLIKQMQCITFKSLHVSA